jgi:uncharacterized Fe-S cluster-containing MiaB family protein
VVGSKPRQIIHQILPQKKKKNHNKRAGEVSQGVGPKFKPQNCRKQQKVLENLRKFSG